VIAEGAFLCGVGLGIDEAAPVRAGLDTVPASQAITFVDQHDAVGANKSCTHGANLGAGRIHTVVAQLGDEEILAVADFVGGKSLLAAVWRFDFGAFNLPVGDMVALDPSAVIAFRDVILLGTGADATATPDAFGDVDEHAPPVLGELVVGGGLGCAGLHKFPCDCGGRQEYEQTAAGDVHYFLASVAGFAAG